MSLPLYQIAAQYRADLDALAELEGIDPVTVADTVESLQGDLQDKLRAVIAYSLNLQAQAEAQAAAAKRMAERAKATGARADALLDYARQAMQDTGIAEVATDEWGAKLAKKPPSVEVADQAALPAEFLRVPEPPAPAPDKAKIAAALKAGQEVPGARLVQGYRLAVR